MKRLRKGNLKKMGVSLLVFVGFILAGGWDVVHSEEAIPNVIILTFGGVRNSETIGDPAHQYIPNIWNSLRPEGALYTNLVVENCAFHMPSIQAINTGDIYEATWGIFHPTIFHYVKYKYGLPQNKLWMIGGWFTTSSSLASSSYAIDSCAPCVFTSLLPDEDYKNWELMRILSVEEKDYNLKKRKRVESNVTKWPVWDSMGVMYNAIFMKILRTYRPKLVHYFLGGPECAHYGNHARYVMSLQDIDSMIGELWKFIKEDPFYRDNTYLLITVDHSRDAYYSHHDKTHEPVWLYIYGPATQRGVIIQRPIYHVDIFATVAYLMKVRTHEVKGKILSDCFNK